MSCRPQVSVAATVQAGQDRGDGPLLTVEQESDADAVSVESTRSACHSRAP